MCASPSRTKLDEKLALTEGLLYRRGTFNGSFDELILEALADEKDAEIAFSPGFRWGTTLLPGEAITLEHLMDQTAITYPQTTRERAHRRADQSASWRTSPTTCFISDPYLQQGGDMVRVGGMTYAHRAGGADRRAHLGHDDSADSPMEAAKRYKVAGWAPVAERV